MGGRVIDPASNFDGFADVLIRADGGIGGIRAPVAVPRFAAVERGSVIVDFVDDFERSFLEATQARAAAYSTQGFDLRCPNWLIRLDPTNHNARSVHPKKHHSQRTRSLAK